MLHVVTKHEPHLHVPAAADRVNERLEYSSIPREKNNKKRLSAATIKAVITMYLVFFFVNSHYFHTP